MTNQKVAQPLNNFSKIIRAWHILEQKLIDHHIPMSIRLWTIITCLLFFPAWSEYLITSYVYVHPNEKYQRTQYSYYLIYLTFLRILLLICYSLNISICKSEWSSTENNFKGDFVRALQSQWVDNIPVYIVQDEQPIG